MSFHVPEKFRVTTGVMGSDRRYGNCGAFVVPVQNCPLPMLFYIIASEGEGWEHVSVSLRLGPDIQVTRCPKWEEMCQVKDIFWDAEDCVVQFHPPKSEYVNCHPHCLHLWRPSGRNIQTPPSIMVGLKQGEAA